MLPDFRIHQRDYLLEITQELDLKKLLERILRIATEILAGQAGLIALKEEEGWRVAAAQKIPPALLDYLKPLLAEETRLRVQRQRTESDAQKPRLHR